MQKVHSYEQMRATPESAGKSQSHNSQLGRSSSAMLIPLTILTGPVSRS
jgi:hypothetical protein